MTHTELEAIIRENSPGKAAELIHAKISRDKRHVYSRSHKESDLDSGLTTFASFERLKPFFEEVFAVKSCESLIGIRIEDHGVAGILKMVNTETK